jgi:hypothetical protein
MMGIISLSSAKNAFVDQSTIQSVKDELKKNGALETSIQGVDRVAFFWDKQDGSVADFKSFCLNSAFKTEAEKTIAMNKIGGYFEVLRGHYNKMTLDLKETLHLAKGDVTNADQMFGSYDPSAHMTDDLFENKIAFYILLNFPYYSLDEKTNMGDKMTRQQWAEARLGESFTSRIPAALNQNASVLLTEADNYISDYNIFMGKIVDDKFNSYFPAEMKLISHWNLRDELKSQYAKKDGLKKQNLIYDVMKRIIFQDIPLQVINKNDYSWNPTTNKIYDVNKKEVAFTSEPCERYQHIIKLFNAMKASDEYCPFNKTFIDRKFNEEMEIPQKDVEELFVNFISSPVVKKVGALIQTRLGRKLEAFDIWYDGFKARSGINEDELNKITRRKYPNTAAFKADIPNMLRKLGFDDKKADFITSKIDVDGARGAGHAWGADMKSENAHLRTRIMSGGMDYKGYNIAVHELGHNVEQTLTLQDVDNWLMRGVPNTAFTEAWAFTFQKRDLFLLGVEETNPDKESLDALDNLWSCYEIMGVSLVDMNVWKWLYANPNATKEQLKDQTVKIAKEVWNKYYAEIFGSKDQPILAIYSHMIDNPLYLSAYPIGHLIEFQIDRQIQGKNLASEMIRMCVQGRLIPQQWMKGAVGGKLSGEPTLQAAEAALKALDKKK